MPPRKRARLTPTASTPDATPSSPPPTAKGAGATSGPFTLDSWSTSQETALFKQLIRQKPTGVHKHMNMLSIYHSLKAQGLTHARPKSSAGQSTPYDHTRIPNIWQKLETLYDLNAMDQREENARTSDAGEDESEDERVSQKGATEHEFRLDAQRQDEDLIDDAEDFADRMWARRLRTGSEPGSSDAGSPPPQADSLPARGRGGRTRASAVGRRGSKATATPISTTENGEEEEDQEEEDEGEDGGDEEGEDGEDEDGEEGGEDEGEDGEEEGEDDEDAEGEDEEEPDSKRTTRGTAKGTATRRTRRSGRAAKGK